MNKLGEWAKDKPDFIRSISLVLASGGEKLYNIFKVIWPSKNGHQVKRLLPNFMPICLTQYETLSWSLPPNISVKPLIN